MDEQERYQEAKKRVEEIRGFYFHLVTFIIINAVLVVINLLTSPEYLWFIWPTEDGDDNPHWPVGADEHFHHLPIHTYSASLFPDPLPGKDE